MQTATAEVLNMPTMARYLNDETAAREFMEQLRWPNGPICPRDGCGSTKVYRLSGKATRPGVLKCGACRRQFTVTVGTVFEDSHIPLGKWVMAIYRMCASKKGVSSLQLMRELGVTYKTAWFMTHRVRYAMTQLPLASKLSGIVESDETYVGPKGVRGQRGRSNAVKQPVLTLIERGGGRARSFVIKDAKMPTLRAIIRENVDPSAAMMTDEFTAYKWLSKEYASHETVKHSASEYARGRANVNLAECYFSLFKRGIVGSFHHISRRHMHRYLSEFDFRWNNRGLQDGVIAALAIQAAEGKRLMFRSAVKTL